MGSPVVAAGRRPSAREVPGPPPASSPPGPRFAWQELAVVGLAVVVRLAVLLQLQASPLFRAPKIDSLEYYAWARDVAVGHLAWTSIPIHGPGYPFFLGAVLAVAGDDLFRARVVQALLGGLSCLLVTRLGTRLLGRRGGFLAGALAAVYGPLVYTEVGLFAELLVVLFNLVGLLALERLRLRAGLGPALLAGTALGLSAVTRSTALLLVPIAVALLMRESSAGPARRRLAASAVLLVSAAAVVAPVAWQNWRAERDLVPVQRNGGLNFYIGNGVHGDGTAHVRPGGEWDRLLAAPYRKGLLSPTEHDRYYVQRWLEEARAEPGRYLALLGRKAVLTLHARELRDTHDPAFFERDAPLLRWLPGWGILFPFAALGVWWSRGRPALGRLAVYGAFYLLTCVLLVVGSRYRLPVAPALAVFASAGILAAFERVGAGGWRAAVAPSAALLAVAVVVRLPWALPASSFAEEWSFTGDACLSLNDPERAELAYRRALELDPALGVAAAGQAKLSQLMGRHEEARDRPLALTAADPDYAKPHFLLGQTFRSLGEPQRAVVAFRAAVERRPDDVLAWLELGRELMTVGRADEARLALDRAVALRGDRVEILYERARAGSLTARHRESESLLLRGVALEPLHFDSWMLLAFVRLDLGDLPGAREAVERARALRPRDAFPPFASARLLVRAGEYDAAIAELERALVLRPDFPDARRALERLRAAR